MRLLKSQLPSIALLTSLLLAGLSVAGLVPAGSTGARATLVLAAVVGLGALVLLAAQARSAGKLSGWLRFGAAAVVVYFMAWAALGPVVAL